MNPPSYMVEADVSIDGGAWWPTRVTVSSGTTEIPSKRQAAFDLKRNVAHRATKGDWRRVHVRRVKVWAHDL